MSIVTRAPRFDLTGLDFRYVGFVPLDDAPAYEPEPEDDAWLVGYNTTLAGEPAMLKDARYSHAQQLRFALGQRAARERIAAEMAKPKTPTSVDLVSGLLDVAAWCEGQGGQVGDFLVSLIRDAAGDVQLFGARGWNEYDGRRQVMLDSLSYCYECATRNHDDKR